MLVIDDDPANAAAMEALLDAWDCSVVTATSAADALDTMGGSSGGSSGGSWPPIDLIIADYHLAEGTIGVDAIKTVQARLPERAPALVITADRSGSLRQEVLQCGYPLLTKPVKPAPLRAVISHLLSARRDGSPVTRGD